MTIYSEISYVPRIALRIPDDIDESKHAEIASAIEEANERLERHPKNTREAAIEAAAWALTRSGHGACGVASVITKHTIKEELR